MRQQLRIVKDENIGARHEERRRKDGCEKREIIGHLFDLPRRPTHASNAMRAVATGLLAFALITSGVSAWSSNVQSESIRQQADPRQEFRSSPSLLDQGKDCHAAAANSLHLACSAEGDLDVTDGDKQDVAIALTLCSMDSAKLVSPNECLPWSTREPSTEPEMQRAACLNALHRSPQEWSTYNTYLSDATKLCFALSSKRQADIVRRTYQNISTEKLALLKMMHQSQLQREIEEQILRDAWDKRMTTFEESLYSLVNLQQTAEHDREANAALTSTLQGTVLSLQDQTEEFWAAMVTSGRDTFRKLLSATQNGLNEMTRRQAEQLSTTLSGVLENHSADLHKRKEQASAVLWQLSSDAELSILRIMDGVDSREAQQLENWQSIINSFGLATTMLQDTQDHVMLIQGGVREVYSTSVELRSVQQQSLVTTKDINHNLDGVHLVVSSIGDRLNETMDRLDELHNRGWWNSSSITLGLFGLHTLSLVALGFLALQTLSSVGIFALIEWLLRQGWYLGLAVFKRIYRFRGAKGSRSPANLPSDDNIRVKKAEGSQCFKWSPPPKYGSLYDPSCAPTLMSINESSAFGIGYEGIYPQLRARHDTPVKRARRHCSSPL